MEETNKNEKDNSKKGLFIGFIIILLGINGYQFYLGSNKDKEIAEKSDTISVKVDENVKLVHDIDSVKASLLDLSSRYDQLGLDKKQLEEAVAKLERQKKSLEGERGYKAKYNEIKKELEEIKQMAGEKTGEFEAIKAQRDSLYSINNALKEDKNKLNDSIAQISAKTSALEQKVKIASKLVAINVKTTVINQKSKELDEPIYKAKHIEKLNVKFNYADNKVSEIGGRTVYLRIIEPDGATLQDGSSSGTFFSEGQEITYTAKQDHLFDNSQKTVAFLYPKPANGFKPGKYLTEVYTDGDKSGEGSFMVK